MSLNEISLKNLYLCQLLYLVVPYNPFTLLFFLLLQALCSLCFGIYVTSVACEMFRIRKYIVWPHVPTINPYVYLMGVHQATIPQGYLLWPVPLLFPVIIASSAERDVKVPPKRTGSRDWCRAYDQDLKINGNEFTVKILISSFDFS